MYRSLATKFPNGLATAADHQVFHNAGIPDPAFAQLYHNDFNTFVAADLTLLGAGAPAVALNNVNGPGGMVQLSTSAANNDSAFLEQPTVSFVLTPGKHHFFKARFSVSDAVNCNIFAGLAYTGPSPIGSSDSLFLFKQSGGTTWILRSMAGGSPTDTPLPGFCVLAANTFVEVGFHVDQQGNVEVFYNSVSGAQPPIAGAGRARVLGVQGVNLSVSTVGPAIGLQSTTASAKTMLVDYLTMSSER